MFELRDGDLVDVDIKPRQRVMILKGTEIRSMHPQKPRYHAGRNYMVKVCTVLPGHKYNAWVDRSSAPTVSWAGEGGYWCYANANDVKIV